MWFEKSFLRDGFVLDPNSESSPNKSWHQMSGAEDAKAFAVLALHSCYNSNGAWTRVSFLSDIFPQCSLKEEEYIT